MLEFALHAPSYHMSFIHSLGALAGDGSSLLHWACDGGSKQTVQYLVEDLKLDIGQFIKDTTSILYVEMIREHNSC